MKTIFWIVLLPGLAAVELYADQQLVAGNPRGMWLMGVVLPAVLLGFVCGVRTAIWALSGRQTYQHIMPGEHS